MKKIFYAFLLMTAACHTNVFADGSDPLKIPFETKDGTGISGGIHRSPILVPEVYLDTESHMLLFSDALYDCSINLVDAAGEVVYSSIIPDGAEEFQLPLTLSGVYELQIVRGNYMFVGYINL